MADQVFTSFKPAFSPSKLTDYFGRVHEKNEVKLVLKHFPHYDHSNENIKKNISCIPLEYKAIINEEVEKTIDRKLLMFDDESAKRNIQERIRESTKTAQNNHADLTNKQTDIDEKSLIVDDSKHAANINPFSNPIEDDETETETEHEEESDYNNNLPKINLTSYIKKQASFSRGKKMEQPTINKVNEKYEKGFEKCLNYIKKDMDSFYLYGRPDGIDQQNKLVVEIKTATNLKLNDQNEIILDNKTRIQCLCYLKLTGFNTCWCVHLGSDGTLKKTEIAFDENEFDELVVSKLNAIVEKYRNMSEQDFIGLVNKYFPQ